MISRADRQFRRMAKRSNYPQSEDMEKKVNVLLEELTGRQSDDKQYTIYRKVAIACMAVIVVGVLAKPAAAAVNYVAKRMQQVPETTQEKLYEEQQNAQGDEAIRYSRALSEQEQQRYDQLFAEYEKNGKMPEKELFTEDTYSETKDYPVYTTKDRRLWLPERDLTDEEMLQIIDYYHVVDYSLQNENQKKQALTEETSTEVTGSDKEIVQQQAITLLETTFGVDAESFKIEVSSDVQGQEDEELYVVDFLQEDHLMYEIYFQKQDLKQVSISIADPDKDYYGKSAKVTDDMLREMKQQVVTLCEAYGYSVNMKDSIVEYKINEEDKIPSGNVRLFCSVGDGAGYCFLYNIPYGEIWCVDYMPYMTGNVEAQQSNANNIEYNKEKGITQLWLPFE